ncbi:MAG: tetraacyldisaccharide 4'-kinase [Deltaproteobacteria bacterium]|nr:tetraacyldisaccharide 4'-kinase [Deltaproteobacteria bacterium]
MSYMWQILKEWMERKDISWYIHIPLYLLSLFYRLGVWGRLFFYKVGIFKTKALPCKVISIGNITVGGSGKTPMVIYMAGLLRGMGKKVVILSRGYGRRGKGGMVSDGKRILLGPEKAGDEPYLMAKRLKKVPILVSRDRYSTGVEAVNRLSPDVIILDDGFQHLRLKRDINILLMDEGIGFGNGYLLPRGILREPLKGIERADVIMVKDSGQWSVVSGQFATHNSQLTTHNYNTPVFSFRYHPIGLRELASGKDVGLNTLNGKQVFALAGIANPLSFIETLEDLGVEVIGKIFYPDHHRYSPSDIDAIGSEIQGSTVKPPNSPLTTHHSPLIVTTAKDGVKLKKFTIHSCLGTDFKSVPIYVLDIEVRVEGAEEFKQYLVAHGLGRDLKSVPI